MGITFTLPNCGVWAKTGAMAQQLANASSPFKLFKNNHTVSDSDTAASLTEADFGGYAQQTWPGSSVISAKTATTATLSVAPVTFSCTGGPANTIYGAYLITDPRISGGYELVVACNLPGGPQVVSQPGDSIVVQLTLTDTRAPGQP